jgi:DNA (cytosine-5)-methyltransferase 1
MAHGQGNAEVCEGKSPTLNCNHEAPILSRHEVFCLAENTIGRKPANGGNGTGVQEGVAYTLNATGVHGVAAVFQQNQRGEVRGHEGCRRGLQANAGMTQQNYVSMASFKNDAARGECWEEVSRRCGNRQRARWRRRAWCGRLTPLECERLMGLPRQPHAHPWKGKAADECPDGPRYKACGNSMCVNVMEWLGRRIEKVKSEELGVKSAKRVKSYESGVRS